MKKILIVEDDKFLRDLISRKIMMEGFQALEAPDGEKGVEIAAKDNPDLILLDLILPGISGFDALEKMKNSPSSSKIPVIILSNLAQRDDIEKGIKMGAVDYLVKAKFTPNEIIGKIKDVLDKNL